MAQSKIKVVVSPDLMEKLGGDIEIRISLKDCRNEASAEDGGDMLSYMEDLIARKREAGRLRTAETYQTTLNRWRDFLKEEKANDNVTLQWQEVTAQLMASFNEYLFRRKVKKNTQSFYFRILRAVCNRAQRNGHEIADGVFDGVYTGKQKTKKRALKQTDIQRIANMETLNAKETFACDMFVFSFITRGMATVDIAHLTPSCIGNGRLVYKRHKTEQVISVAWLDEMRRIVTKYKNENSRFLFPIIKGDESENWTTYKREQQKINYWLKKLGKRLRLPMPLTMYVARHSWATIAKASGIPTAIISDAMGHTSERTTQIYLDSIDNGRIDAANQKIVGNLFKHS